MNPVVPDTTPQPVHDLLSALNYLKAQGYRIVKPNGMSETKFIYGKPVPVIYVEEEL